MEPAGGVLLLDGGTGHLLKDKGVEQLVSGLPYEQLFLAGCLANLQRPDLVAEVHAAYVAAGVDVLTTNSFACTQHMLGKIGRAAQQAELVAAAGRIARGAADAAGRRVLVAGSLPPLMESYQATRLPGPDAMLAQYQRIAGALAPHADVLLCETLATVAEGVAAATAAAATGRPVWVSWTLEDSLRGRLRSGEPLKDAVAAVVTLPGLQALLVNCCSPQAVAAALPRLRAAVPAGLRLGGYANGFATTTSEWLAGSSGSGGEADEAGAAGGEDLAAFTSPPREEYDDQGLILPEAYARHTLAWRSAGASIVGGCCGVGPAHIARMRQELGVLGGVG